MRRFFLFSVISFFLLHVSAAVNHPINTPVTSITITVYKTGSVVIGGKRISTENLADELKKKLWDRYLVTGKLYDSIKIKMVGEVLMGVRGSVLQAIIAGMQKTLNDLSQKKYNASFDNLDPARQNTIRKQYPVLFQELHW